MSRRRIGFIVAVVGLLIALISASADTIGLGEAHGFGPSQFWGTIAGVVVFLVGLSVSFKPGPPC